LEKSEVLKIRLLLMLTENDVNNKYADGEIWYSYVKKLNSALLTVHRDTRWWDDRASELCKVVVQGSCASEESNVVAND
jgi:hypothetical protein